LRLTALLYLWDLGRNGWANDFYAAAGPGRHEELEGVLLRLVRPSSFITVDKTPGSLWVMELSGRIFGFSQWSMLAAAGAGGRGFGPAALRRGQALVRARGRADRRGWCSRSPRRRR
jgi:4-amino-4-deoxy-L-arabinose transferase-like glycosyltransferase